MHSKSIRFGIYRDIILIHRQAILESQNMNDREIAPVELLVKIYRVFCRGKRRVRP
jgi:hypothetical protein